MPIPAAVFFECEEHTAGAGTGRLLSSSACNEGGAVFLL